MLPNMIGTYVKGKGKVWVQSVTSYLLPSQLPNYSTQENAGECIVDSLNAKDVVHSSP